MPHNTPHDIALSFAGQNREYVDRVAEILEARAVSVFYDRHFESRLWGKNLLDYFDTIFRRTTRFFCVVFVSEAYANGEWTNHERRYVLDRAFHESSEYVLPVRFDDTDILGGVTSTTGYIDARIKSPKEVAELICEKIQDARFESERFQRTPGFNWFGSPELQMGGHRTALKTFQQMTVSYETSPLENLVSGLVRRLLNAAQRNQKGVYWTTRDDSRFEKIYATSSVLTAIGQVGPAHNPPLIESAVDFLKDSTASSIDDRAATVYLLISGNLAEDPALDFLDTLALRQIRGPDIDTEGSFLFQQGTEGQEHWRRSHRDAESFHACHIADALLHIPEDYTQCRRKAEPILDGIRGFLIRSYTMHDGWLMSADSQKSPVTLYSYALCPALRIPLPREWRKIAAECMDVSAQYSARTLARFFGIMNAVYVARSVRDEDFTRESRNFVRRQLRRMPSTAELNELTIPDLAALLRSVAYGVTLVDSGFDSAVRATVAETFRTWDEKVQCSDEI